MAKNEIDELISILEYRMLYAEEVGELEDLQLRIEYLQHEKELA